MFSCSVSAKKFSADAARCSCSADVSVITCVAINFQWWIEGWATGAAAQGTKGGGHQRGESKNNANLHDENVIDFIILNTGR